MCQRVTCEDCGKATYAGCGRHVEAVLRDVPPEARCHCVAEGASDSAGPTKLGAWFSALRGRSAGRQA